MLASGRKSYTCYRRVVPMPYGTGASDSDIRNSANANAIWNSANVNAIYGKVPMLMTYEIVPIPVSYEIVPVLMNVIWYTLIGTVTVPTSHGSAVSCMCHVVPLAEAIFDKREEFFVCCM